MSFDGSSVWCPLFRLYAHALLRGSHIFPDMKLCDKSLDYEPLGFVDIWKENYRGDRVCIKAIRTRSTTRLGEIKRVRGRLFFDQDQTQCASHQAYCRGVEEYKYLSHPNVLPVIEVSETLFPLCIMSPWMPDGNIMQYTHKNRDANRLMLVGIHQN